MTSIDLLPAKRLARLALLSLTLAQVGLNAQPLTASEEVSFRIEAVLPVVVPADAVLTVKPDRADWTYPLRTAASFRIAFDLEPYPAEGVPITYRLGPDMREGDEIEARVPAEGLSLPVAAQTAPGFVRCIVRARVDGRVLTAIATAGFAPQLIRKSADGQISDTPAEPKLAASRYYDSVNFARRLKVPGHYGWGFNDNVTPPTSLHAVYNEITAPKHLVIAPEMGHNSSVEQNTLRTDWILQQAGLKK